MRNKPVRFIFCTVALFFFTAAFSAKIYGQQHVDKPGWWLIYFGDNKLNDKFGLHTEVQLRNHFAPNTVETSFFRLGLNYYTSKSTIATVGYGYFYNEPNNPELPFAITREHRTWQQFLTRHKTRKLFMEHRYRLEQRFIEFGDDTPALTDHRIRYRFQAIFPFYTISPYLRHYFLAGYNEVMLNFREASAEVYDRNRFYIALGYQVSPKLNFQLGYMSQIARQGSLPTLEYNNLVQATVSYNMDDLMRTFFRPAGTPEP